MPTLHTYQLLNKELPAILMTVLMTLAFTVVLVVILLRKQCSSDNEGRVTPLVFIETIELYLPNINSQKKDIEVFGQKMSPWCFAIMSILLIPITVGTMFITFWNVCLVEEEVRGDCVATFDCFPKLGDDFLQQEPVNNCSVFELNGNVTYECYRLVFRYAEGLGAAGGILFFTAVVSKLYFSLLITVYNNMGDDRRLRCCRFILYGIIWAVAFIVSILFVGISFGVPVFRETIFQTITDQIQFAMYALSLLVIVVSGAVVATGIETPNTYVPV